MYSQDVKEEAKRLRREKDLGLGVISDKLGIPSSTISNWLSGKVEVDRSKATSIGVKRSYKDKYPGVKNIKGSRAIKNRLIDDRGHRCEKCSREEWLSEPIPLEIHRTSPEKDYEDCTSDDVLLLCPNCHARTEDYKGSNNQFNWDEENVKQAVLNNNTKADALRELGVPTNGGAYNTLNRYIDVFDISTAHMNYVKNFSCAKNTCEDCSQEISREASRCKSCAQKHKNNYKIDWPSDAKLRKMVWNEPVTKIADRLGVSDKAVSKRCKNRGIDTPGRGYWQKKSR